VVVAANPFHYGTPVDDADHFAGRHSEMRALSTRMSDGINVVLSSPRRYGKTSLLLLAERELHEQRAAIIHVNVLRCRDETDLAERLAGGVYRMPGGLWHRAGHAATEFARRLRVTPTVTLGPDGSPRFGFGGELASRDADTVIADAYALLAEEAPKRPAVLILDEFQAITDLGAHLPGVLKALADEHPEVSLVLAGSRAHLMERLTGSTGAPLYGMAERLSLGPIPDADMVPYLQRRSEAGGKPMELGVAGTIIERAGPVPNDIQRLAYAAYDLADRTITAADVRAAMTETVSHDAAAYAETFQRLTAGQRRVLTALAGGITDPLFSARFAQSVGLASNASVRRVIDALSEQDLIIQRDGTWQVGDPFFAAWLVEPV
jgi:uncharacterized protein